MQNVKFNSSSKLEKEFAITLRKNVNNYFKENQISMAANATMVIKTIILISIYVVPFILILTIPMSLWFAFILTIVMGIGIAGVGMGVMHDACHGAYSKKPWVNNLLSGTIYLLGSNMLNWKIQHNVLHHTFTNISGLDEDIDEKGPIRLSFNTPLKKIHKFQFIYAFFFYGLMTLSMLVNDFTRLFGYNRKGLVKHMNKKLTGEYIKMAIRKVVYLFVIIGLPLWLTDFKFYQIAIGFFAMHWVASIILSLVFQMAHVVEGADQIEFEPTVNSDWHVHQLKTTSDFAHNNKLLSWYVGGLNFQIEHHLFPNICHVHYNKIAPIVEKTAKEFGVEYNLKPTFFNALYSHFLTLKALGTH